MVVAQHAAEAAECVGLELPGLLVLAQSCQGEAEDGGCLQGHKVLLAEDSAAPGEGVVHELPSLLIVTH